jgi:thiol-disulfide isomerase/thioredoxin
LAVLALLFSVACAREERPAHLEARIDVPDFTLETVDGRPVSLSDFKDKSPVLLMFWATWCPYCVGEMPQLMELRGRVRGNDLAILAIDLEEDRDRVAAYVEARGVNFPVLLDSDARVAGRYGVEGVPTFVLIDRQGKGVVADNRLSPGFLDLVDTIIAEKNRG